MNFFTVLISFLGKTIAVLSHTKACVDKLKNREIMCFGISCMLKLHIFNSAEARRVLENDGIVVPE